MEAGWGLSRPAVINFPPNQTDLHFPHCQLQCHLHQWSTHSNHLNEFTNSPESLSHISINYKNCISVQLQELLTGYSAVTTVVFELDLHFFFALAPCK